MIDLSPFSILFLATVLSLVTLVLWQRHQIIASRAEVKRLELDNKIRADIIVSQGRLIAFWRNVAIFAGKDGAFAEFIDSLNFNRVERKR